MTTLWEMLLVESAARVMVIIIAIELLFVIGLIFYCAFWTRLFKKDEQRAHEPAEPRAE